MRFEVPAGSALVFTDVDGQLLAQPTTRLLSRIVQAPIRSAVTGSVPEA